MVLQTSNWNSIDDLPIHPSWKPALTPVMDTIAELGDFLQEEQEAGRGYLPAREDIFRAFTYPFDEVKVLIVGQDPYPTPGHAMGLSFSTQPGVRPLPRSLNNIYKELGSDLGTTADPGDVQATLDLGLGATGQKAPHAQAPNNPDSANRIPQDGDLTAWSRQGVALFNRVLTVAPGAPASHKGKGWEAVTEAAITALGQSGQPLVAILWGKQAQSCQKFLGDTPSICSAHPSPLSASRGFFGSRPFSRTNEILSSLGATEVNWQL